MLQRRNCRCHFVPPLGLAIGLKIRQKAVKCRKFFQVHTGMFVEAFEFWGLVHLIEKVDSLLDWPLRDEWQGNTKHPSTLCSGIPQDSSLQSNRAHTCAKRRIFQNLSWVFRVSDGIRHCWLKCPTTQKLQVYHIAGDAKLVLNEPLRLLRCQRFGPCHWGLLDVASCCCYLRDYRTRSSHNVLCSLDHILNIVCDIGATGRCGLIGRRWSSLLDKAEQVRARNILQLHH
mmetsp:Transcript_12951/g.22001  ORF Transcript_12951/g.22001 Transcript_12951/m.22001 type:complete len:230 (+) Transcript_12951:277-966(+)